MPKCCQFRVVVGESHALTLRSGRPGISDRGEQPLLRQRVAPQFEGPQSSGGGQADYLPSIGVFAGEPSIPLKGTSDAS